jgi:peptidylprolyl isomerase
MKLITLLLSVLLSVGFVSCSTEPEGTVEITDTLIGTGAEATRGKYITVHYVGTLTNGTKFDSSRDRFQPLSFTLGSGEMIQGWEKGIPGMKVGGKRKLVIPPSLGYGSMARPGIPANSTLIFDVELLSVK